jgi:hypothetical protein
MAVAQFGQKTKEAPFSLFWPQLLLSVYHDCGLVVKRIDAGIFQVALAHHQAEVLKLAK